MQIVVLEQRKIQQNDTALTVNRTDENKIQYVCEIDAYRKLFKWSELQ